MPTARIQRRLLSSYLLLILAVLVPAFVLLDRWLGGDLREDLRRSLAGQARLLAAEFSRAPPADPMAWAHGLGGATGGRVTLIARDGRVLGDTDVESSQLPQVENHAARPEVRAALLGGEGMDVRHSATVGRDLMYVAVPVGTPPTHVMRIALPVEQVTRSVARAQSLLWLTGLGALVLALALGWILARRVSRPVVAMTQAARAMTRGDFASPLPDPTEDELGDLVQALHVLRGQLARRIDELRAEGAKLRTILDGMTEGVALVQDGVITVANQTFREMFGGTPEVEGRTPLETSRLPQLGEAIEQAAARRETVATEATAAGRVLAVQAIPLGEVAARQLVVVVLDVTDARRSERLRRDFVANASHELRTPVAAILGAAETLDATAGEPEAHARFVDILLRHARRLSRLTEDLLDLSRLESGYEPRIETVDIAAALAAALGPLLPRAADKSIALAARAEGLPPVAAERAAVEQILANLVDNAIKYTPPGGRVTVSGVADPRAVRISVADTGPGIAAEHLPRLFERFYRVDSARSRELGGTGLGLAIVKHLAIANGGEVTVESRVGEGTRFTVTLRRA